ncbi:hypothetical protein MBT84_27275 [Streptomyces sp. MBT84]|nr:hypothetical protein [Streptomyces sp. MBT84]
MPDVESTAGHVPGLRLRWGDLPNCQLHVFGHANPPAPPGPRHTTTGRAARHKPSDPPRPARPRIPRMRSPSPASSGPAVRGEHRTAGHTGRRPEPAQTRLITEATDRRGPGRGRAAVRPGRQHAEYGGELTDSRSARRARPFHRRADAVTVRGRDMVGRLAPGRTQERPRGPRHGQDLDTGETAAAPRTRVRKSAGAHVARTGRNPGPSAAFQCRPAAGRPWFPDT